ncbi:four helix bundle protein [Candidatus Uabimicrobium sp. HlEnr_7]|uniref:four helix bundle protein n=1 Tax=Candidatus Uabimicrobium helgolandensis TaxID=3095367 RepID=UPI00355646B9
MAALYHLDRASTSIVLNIAQGNGKYTPKDRYFDIARESALESAGALDIIITKEYYPKEQINLGKNMLRSIVSMLRTSQKSVALKLLAFLYTSFVLANTIFSRNINPFFF